VAADHQTPLILDALQRAGGVGGRRVLLLRGEQTLEDLPAALRAQGCALDDVACFGTRPEPDDPTGHAARFQEAGADWIVFASALAIEHFHARFDLLHAQRRFPDLRLAICSPDIRWALEALGLHAAVTARPNDPQSMVDALIGAARTPLDGL
jgi:uroporphyrinogen-III synthase